MLGMGLSHLQRFRFCTFVATFIKQTIVQVNEKRHTETQEVNSNYCHHQDEIFKGYRHDTWEDPEMNIVTIWEENKNIDEGSDL